MATNGAESGPPRGSELLDRVVANYQEARCVLTAARLGIFEALARGPLPASRLASDLGLDPARAPRLLDALTALGLLEKQKGAYRLEAGVRHRLGPGEGGRQAELFRHQDRMFKLWADLDQVLRGAREGGWEDRDDGETREFVLAMEANALRRRARVTASVDLAGVGRLLDLGGGPGTYARHFVARQPGLLATVFDRPEVAAVVGELGLNRGFEGAIDYREGNLLTDELGTGYDLIWASNLFHSFDRRETRDVLERCRAALAPGGRLAVHDFFLDETGTAPRRAAIFSVHMLAVTPRGMVFRRSDFVSLLEEGGFRDVRQLCRIGDSTVLQAEA